VYVGYGVGVAVGGTGVGVVGGITLVSVAVGPRSVAVGVSLGDGVGAIGGVGVSTACTCSGLSTTGHRVRYINRYAPKKPETAPMPKTSATTTVH
jgi:hypothetical protein